MNNMKKSILLTLFLAISGTSFISAGDRNRPSLGERFMEMMRRGARRGGSRGGQVTPADVPADVPADTALTPGQTTPPPAAAARAGQPPALPRHTGLTPETNRNLAHPTGLTPERNPGADLAPPSTSVTNARISFAHGDGVFRPPATDPQEGRAVATYPPGYTPGTGDMGPAGAGNGTTAPSHDGGFYRAPVQAWTNHPHAPLAGVFPPGYKPAGTYPPRTGDMGPAVAGRAGFPLYSPMQFDSRTPLLPGYVPSGDDSPTSTGALSPSMLSVATSPVRSDSICTICQYEINRTDDTLYCHPGYVGNRLHQYHANCLTQWQTAGGSSCPDCHRTFTTSPIKPSNRAAFSPMPVSGGKALFSYVSRVDVLAPEQVAYFLSKPDMTEDNIFSTLACLKTKRPASIAIREINAMLYIALAKYHSQRTIRSFKSSSLDNETLGQAVLVAIRSNNVNLLIDGDLLYDYAKKTKNTTMKKTDSTDGHATNADTLVILNEAIEHGSAETFKQIYHLLSAADIRCIGTEETRHAFLFAARSGRYDIITMLLELACGSNLLAARGSENETPLMLATRIPNNPEMVIKFLEIKRETVDDADHNGHTVLTHPETLPEYHAVLNNGRPTAPPMTPRGVPSDPLDQSAEAAAPSGPLTLGEVPSDPFAGATAPPMTSEQYEDFKASFLLAVATQNVEKASEYLRGDATLANLKDSDGTPAIILATQTGNIAMITLLKKYGVDLTATDAHGFTAYDVAVYSSQDHLFDLLKPRG